MISPPEDSYVLSTARFPHPVWLEGVKAGYGAHLYFEYRPYCDAWYPLQDPGDDIIRVVEAYQIEQVGTGLTGPLYVVCPDDTIQLQVLPWPSEGPWPEGEPHWEVIVYPDGATPSLTPSSGWPMTGVSGFNKPGCYVVQAKCGELDDGDDITIITPPPASAWMEFAWDIHCPLHVGESPSVPLDDDCGNRLTVVCDGSAFHFYYKPAGAEDRTQVGICVWEGGQNEFWYKSCSKVLYGKERFLETWHTTANDRQGVDQDGEGCLNYYCWRVQKHDCVVNGPILGSPWWRRALEGAGHDELDGDKCLNILGLHRGYPN